MSYLSCNSEWTATSNGYINCSTETNLVDSVNSSQNIATCTQPFINQSNFLNCPSEFANITAQTTTTNYVFELDNFDYVQGYINNPINMTSSIITITQPPTDNTEQAFLKTLVSDFNPVVFGLIITATLTGMFTGVAGGFSVGLLRKIKNSKN